MGTARVVPQMKLTLFVCRSSQQWVVLDSDGNFWMLPSVENPWDHASRSTRPRRPSSSLFPDITDTCSVCLFAESKVHQ